MGRGLGLMAIEEVLALETLKEPEGRLAVDPDAPRLRWARHARNKAHHVAPRKTDRHRSSDSALPHVRTRSARGASADR